MMLLLRPDAVLAVAACPGQSTAQAQQYPTQDIRFTRVFPASIGADVPPHSGGCDPDRAGDTASFKDLSTFKNMPFVMPGPHIMRD
jgi:hypothetical protein